PHSSFPSFPTRRSSDLRMRLIGSSPDSPTLSGFPVFVARLPPTPLSSLGGSSVSIFICFQSNRFLVGNALAKSRGIRIRSMEERKQRCLNRPELLSHVGCPTT